MGKTGQRIQAGVGILVLAGAGGAYYVYNHDAALKQEVLQATGAVSKPIPKPPANAPIGFNTSKTAFVLPHKLGYLPAPELALAKSDPAYAAGLANLSDWRHYRPYWFYSPHLGGGTGGGGVVKFNAIGDLGLQGGVPTGDQAVTSSVPIHNFTPHLLPDLRTTTPIYGQEFVNPSVLEMEAAPVRDSLLHAADVCVPSPVAFVHNGHIDVPSQLPAMTAGPSTIFTYGAGATTWDQGTASCKGFQ
jgi:hypothetical protein